MGGAALLYRSRDLVAWEYLNPILVGDVNRREPVWAGSMWECPQLFPLGDRHVLLVSVWHERTLHYAAYAVGAFDGRRLAPEAEGVLDPGSLYAPQTLRDDRDRRILFGWLREGRSREAIEAAGWAGVLSLPWLLSLGPDNLPRYTPAPELEALRGAHTRYTDLAIDAAAGRTLGVVHRCFSVDKSHTLTVRSQLPAASVFPSGEIATHSTSPVCFSRACSRHVSIMTP